ncbi:hypothetical protein [Winogradskyella ursingii]|uniref:hypothetical protein n=1 Tax=Winogradskyella ursingii TaxID=2686079 RepID=UPI0015CB59C0|nr:hypothetical protein [Winogradskyella ursingii]
MFQYVFNKQDKDKVQDSITNAVNPTKKTRDLEKQLEFSDTYANRIALADSYYQNKNFVSAISNYKKSLEDTVQDDFYAQQQLVLSYYQLHNYEKTIEHAEKIQQKPEFKGSKQQFCYGMALKEVGETEKAEFQLKQIDRPYSNYSERLELAKLYLETDRINVGKTLLDEISAESKNMTEPNRRIYRNTILEVERLLSSL